MSAVDNRLIDDEKTKKVVISNYNWGHFLQKLVPAGQGDQTTSFPPRPGVSLLRNHLARENYCQLALFQHTVGYAGCIVWL